MWVIYILYSIIFGIATSYIARQKGKDGSIWFWIGAILGIIGLLIIGFSKDEENNLTHTEKDYTKNAIVKNKTPNIITDLDSPIDIMSNEIIVNEGEVHLFSRVKNISKAHIASFTFNIQCFDSFNQPVKNDEDAEYIIQDLELAPNEVFNEEIFVDLTHLPAIRKVNIFIMDVLFNNGEVWNYDKGDIINTELIPAKDERDLELIREFNGEDVISLYELQTDRWICICGRNNKKDLKACVRCNRDKNMMQSNFSIDKIEETIKSYERKIESNNIRVLEQNERNKQLIEQEKAEIKKFIFRVILLIGLIFLVTYILERF